MKEVLIYGALIAAVLGASVQIISGFTTTLSQQGSTINEQIVNQTQKVISSVSN